MNDELIKALLNAMDSHYLKDLKRLGHMEEEIKRLKKIEEKVKLLEENLIKKEFQIKELERDLGIKASELYFKDQEIVRLNIDLKNSQKNILTKLGKKFGL